MNLYNVLDIKEKEIINNLEIIEDREYSKEEISYLENKIIEDIMSNSKKNIDNVRDMYSTILNKLEK